MPNEPAEQPVGEVLEALERKLFLLRNEYEQYFLGLIKKEPMDKRDEVQLIFRNLQKQRMNNTAHNFRYQQLKARFSSLSLYWTRILKQIEDGTYKRDVFRLRLKEEEEKKRQAEEKEKKSMEEKEAEAARKRDSDRPVPPSVDTVADPLRLQTLFQQFIQVRQQCNERTDNVQFDKMVEFMQSQTRAIKERYQCRAVTFQVVEDGGRTKLKAIPIK